MTNPEVQPLTKAKKASRAPSMTLLAVVVFLVVVAYLFPPYPHYTFIETEKGLVRCNTITGRVDYRAHVYFDTFKWKKFAEED